jgi:hypothetical protein
MPTSTKTSSTTAPSELVTARREKAKPKVRAPAYRHAKDDANIPPPLVHPGVYHEARYWRGLLEGALRRNQAPAELLAVIQSGIDVGAWKMFRPDGGGRFRTFDDFCRGELPIGLGRDPEEVHELLRKLLGERAEELATVSPAMRGVSRDRDPSTGLAGRFSERKEQRLRAVQERAPEVVRHLCAMKLIGLEAAARLGIENPTEEQRQTTESLAAALMPIRAELGDKPAPTAMKRARQQIRELFPAETNFDKALKQFKKCSLEEQERFLTMAHDIVSRKRPVAAE